MGGEDLSTLIQPPPAAELAKGETPASLQTPTVDVGSYPAPRYAWYVACVLCLAYAASFVDRQVLGLLIVPIQDELHLSDSSISLLYGLGFSLSYTLMGLPLGRLADRVNRTALIGISAAFWSTMTAACGMAQSAFHLLLARLGVGVGEAGLSPGAFSLISDYFPPHKRPLATSLYVMGTTLGSAAALIGGGAILAAAASRAPLLTNIFGDMSPWRITFILVCVPGVLVALLMLTVREVPRKEKLTDRPHIPMRELVAFIRARWQLYGGHNLGMAMASLLTNGFAAWIPTYFMRTFGWTPTEVGYRYGVVILLCGGIGVLVGGIVASWLARRGVARSSFVVSCFGMACLTPLAIMAPLMPTADGAWAMFAAYTFVATFPTGCAAAALMEVTPNQMRGYMAAVYLFANAMIGMTFGPSSIAFVTDFVFGDRMAVGESMSLVACVACPLSALLLYAALRAARRTASGWSAA